MYVLNLNGFWGFFHLFEGVGFFVGFFVCFGFVFCLFGFCFGDRVKKEIQT